MADLIYRQAAIDAIMRYANSGMRRTRDIVEKLPSAPQWIPINERLPEEGKPVLGTFVFQDGNGCLTTERIVIGGKERWSASGGLKPIAWMPLPEPYRAERREDG